MSPEVFAPEHFRWNFEEGVATVTLNRPERKNPLTFESYAELRDTFRALVYTPEVKAVVVTGAGGNFSSGGDVHEIIGPLTEMGMPGLLKFTRMTGDLVKAMRLCPQPIVAALDGVCVGAGAIMAMASDLRLATPETKTAFLFTRVGFAGATWAPARSCAPHRARPRFRTALHRPVMTAEEGERWGFHNRLVERDR
jgi:enoyl-CoA hydratase/carnithine racemase